jgi:protein-arginine kinase activator protein McsA
MYPNYLNKYLNKILLNRSLEDSIKSELNESEMTKKVYEKDGVVVTEISGRTASGGFYSETTYSYKNNTTDHNKLIEQKSTELSEAIKKQDFERAAILRDTILALKQNQ